MRYITRKKYKNSNYPCYLLSQLVWMSYYSCVCMCRVKKAHKKFVYVRSNATNCIQVNKK